MTSMSRESRLAETASLCRARAWCTSRRLRVGVAMFLAAPLFSCGLPAFSDVLSPNLADVLNAGAVASVPGDAPFLLVTFENRTTRRVSFSGEATANGTLEFVGFDLDPEGGGGGGSASVGSDIVVCPVTELTIGSINDLSQSGVFVFLGGGFDTDPIIQVEPLGILLVEGVQFNCGDEVRFIVDESTATASGFRTFVQITPGGSTTP